MDTIVEYVRQTLREKGDAASIESSKRFFKEEDGCPFFHGVKSAEVRSLAKEGIKRLKGSSKEEVFALCEKLWQSGYLEEGGIACEWAYARRKEFSPEDFSVFARWIENYVNNWASCDTLCNHTVGEIVMQFPALVEELKAWTGSSNRWLRRAAAVSLIIPARKGKFLEDIFIIAENLLEDDDHLVQKGYGWMLKAASEASPEEVFTFLMARREGMPRTAFRYALEKMPKEWRAKAMAK